MDAKENSGAKKCLIDREGLQERLVKIMDDRDVPIQHRLKAIELCGKTIGMFDAENAKSSARSIAIIPMPTEDDEPAEGD